MHHVTHPEKSASLLWFDAIEFQLSLLHIRPQFPVGQREAGRPNIRVNVRLQVTDPCVRSHPQIRVIFQILDIFLVVILVRLDFPIPPIFGNFRIHLRQTVTSHVLPHQTVTRLAFSHPASPAETHCLRIKFLVVAQFCKCVDESRHLVGDFLVESERQVICAPTQPNIAAPIKKHDDRTWKCLVVERVIEATHIFHRASRRRRRAFQIRGEFVVCGVELGHRDTEMLLHSSDVHFVDFAAGWTWARINAENHVHSLSKDIAEWCDSTIVVVVVFVMIHQ